MENVSPKGGQQEPQARDARYRRTSGLGGALQDASLAVLNAGGRQQQHKVATAEAVTSSPSATPNRRGSIFQACANLNCDSDHINDQRFRCDHTFPAPSPPCPSALLLKILGASLRWHPLQDAYSL